MSQNLLGLAFTIASAAFQNKVDKGGRPYILHCIYVMEGADLDDEDEQIAGLLHDLVEDTDWTIERLRDQGFNERTISLISRLTHWPEHTYDEYIKMISFDKSAKSLKKRDLQHNSDITRIKGIRQKDFERIEKYHKAYLYLTE